MSHEVIHQLDPGPGPGTFLEEGIAADFSLGAIESLKIQESLGYSEPYRLAMRLVRALPGGSMGAGRAVRRRFAKLHGVDADGLAELFPGHDRAALEQLAAPFVNGEIDPTVA
ncbi:MAG: hypothetical protein A2W31_01045 [Planctomycetes bacterium RBG_16_64_10]|nr:MAG: hypothetical protein A2W31_01045 [Planctomycetes bacterium RBG_16_64_10]